jgi:heat shock protein HslJ/uncharacterized membrane protein
MSRIEMDIRTVLVISALSLALTACEKAETPPPAPPAAPQSQAPPETAPAKAAVSFVNRVWVVAESKQVARGELRVFLSDGTLVMASPNATPAFGQWRSEGGRLTITEESRNYPVDILALSEDAFRIRINGPGEPVDILFTPAPSVDPDLVDGDETAAAIARPAAAPETPAASGAPPVAKNLAGTTWRLESLGNGKLQAGTQATLEFPTEGRAGGNGSCNRFNGIVIVAGDGIKFSGLATTRKACAEAVMRQEETYLAALREAVRYEVEGQSLRIFAAGRDEPLRFTAGPAPAAAPAQGIQPAASAESPSLMGIWTVVGHSTPGVAALSEDQARARHGESLRLTRRIAASNGQRCETPQYAGRTERAQEFLGNEYRIAPDSLKPVARREQLRVMRVSCGGSAWDALGGTLIELDRDRALAPRDGVFFELARDRDFRAVGQEPGWQLEIRMGSEMRFTYDYGQGSAVTPAAHAVLDARTGTRSFHARTEANDLRVEIVPVKCEDAMSGKPYPATVTVTLNDRSFRGCGEPLATPFQG